MVCLYFCAQRISTRPALGVPECVGEPGVRGERGGLPGLTFQHLDSHFHGSLRMAQAVSCGLHHLPKSPGAQGAAWERDDLSAADPQRISTCMLSEVKLVIPQATLDLRCFSHEGS